MTDTSPWTRHRLCAALDIRVLAELPPRGQSHAERILNCSEMLRGLDDKREREGSESEYAAGLRAQNERELARYLGLIGVSDAGRAA